jgi:predicted CXXCH cytochrome family protein
MDSSIKDKQMNLKIYYMIVLLIVVLLSCSRETAKFFFDGVDEKSELIYQNPDSTVRQEFRRDTSDTNNTMQINPLSGKVSVHPAYQNKLCEKCHDVNHSYRLINRQPEICYTCHKSFEEVYDVLHGPVAAGFCTTCHQPHQSENEKLLVLPVREVCQYCHQPGDVDKNQAHQKVSNNNCMTCHNAHGGKTTHLLKE